MRKTWSDMFSRMLSFTVCEMVESSKHQRKKEVILDFGFIGFIFIRIMMSPRQTKCPEDFYSHAWCEASLLIVVCTL